MTNRIKNLFYPLVLIFGCSLTLINLQSCEQEFVNNPAGTVPFPAEIESIFNTPYTASSGNSFTCSTPSCHASGNNTGGLDLVDWQKAMNGSNNGSMIIPYNGYWSHIISYLNKDTNTAPVSYIDTNSVFYEIHKIDPQKVATIMNWINDGAKSKDGQVAFTSIDNSVKGFITNQAADLVAVIKTDQKLVTRLVPVGGVGSSLNSPHYITISPDKRFFYVSLISAGYVEKYDLNNYNMIARLATQIPSPAHIEISPDGLTGFITNFSSSTSITQTTKFNTETMSVLGVFSDPGMTGPHGMALSNDGTTLFIASEIGEYIFKISTSNFYASDTTFIKATIDPSVPPSGNGTGNFRPYQVLLSQDESLLYVSCRGSNQVRIYNTTDLTQVNAIFLGANSFPLLMKITADGNYLFVCNRNNNTVSVINCQTQTIAATIPNVGIQPHGVDFTADGQYAIIACETLSGFDGHHPTVGSKKPGVSRIIQISNLSLLPGRLEMASFPAGIAIVK